MNTKYRKTVIAANWKMNKNPDEAKLCAEGIRFLSGKVKWCDVVICPPAIDIATVGRVIKDCRIALGAQNVHAQPSGAYTGEISVDMLKNAGVKYVIVGHSERRKYFGETDSIVNEKLLAALAGGLTPILCLGESLQQREAGIEEEFVSIQLKQALAGVDPSDIRRIVIAYEPIWAIGTGVTATDLQAQQMCQHIRGVLRKIYGARIARAVTILYGGSMNEKNASGLLAQPDIDGGLIGGASLVPEKFAAIVEAARADNSAD